MLEFENPIKPEPELCPKTEPEPEDFRARVSTTTRSGGGEATGASLATCSGATCFVLIAIEDIGSDL